MARKAPDPAAMVAAFKTGIAGGSAKWLKGVMGVTQSPGPAAAAAVESGKWLANLQASMPTMVAKLNALTAPAWQAACQGKQGNYGNAATTAAANYQKVVAQLAAANGAQSAAAAAASGPMEKLRASMNAMKAAFGKPLI